MDLKGKTAVITGASRGIGRAIALKFAECGADIAVIYSGSEEAAGEVCREAAEAGVRAFKYKCNVADYQQCTDTVQKILQDLGKADILVNNAGINRDKLIMQMEEKDFDDVMDVNLKGTFLFIKLLSRQFMKQKQGRIINISSVAGLMGNAGQTNYSASKAGIIGLTKSVAKELAPRNITCNAIAPGFISTDMTGAMPEKALEEAAGCIPLKRIGIPVDIACLAAFLASDMASYITGEIIKVDGGLYI